MGGGYWVAGVGNEVVAGGGVLSAITVILVCYLLKTIRLRMRSGREDGEVVTRIALARRNMRQRGDVGDSAEPESCPICLGHASFPVDTSCGHTFCAECVLSYWQHDQWPRPARCPVCRNQVTLLLPCAALSSSTNPDLWRMVVDYNQRMSGQPRSLLQYLYDTPVILGHVWRLLFTAEGVVLLCRLHILLLLLLVVLYLFSPLDLIPEAVFGVLGLVDDIIILVAVVAYTSQLYLHYITNE